MKTKIFILLLITALHIKAVDIYVPTDYATIQEAINNASTGDVIIVANGTYIENIDFIGKAITVTSLYHLSNNVNDIYNTIIDGSAGDGTDLGSCVSFKNNETILSILKGFTIKNGSGTKTGNEGTFYRTGGGIIIDHASPTILNNIIENNECVATGDVSGAGGAGVRVGYGEPVFMNNIIRNNTGGYAGGIMISRCGSATVFKNNVVVNNTATGSFNGGGGVYIDWYPILLENNTIAYNHSGDKGGGIISTGTITDIKNCIVYGNTATNGSPQIMKRYSGNARITYSCIEGGFDGTGDEIGMITDNPMFENTNNYYLTSSSPCIDSGDHDAIYNDIEDPNNSGNALFPSLGTLINDMGAYGGQNVKTVTLSIKKEIKNLLVFYKNPYENKGLTIFSDENETISIETYSFEGKKRNKKEIVLKQGTNKVEFQIDSSCIVVIKNKYGKKNSFKLLKL